MEFQQGFSFKNLGPADFGNAASSALGATASYMAGIDKVNQINSQRAMLQSTLNMTQGTYDMRIEAIGREKERTLASNRAAFSKSGVSLQGSPIESMMATAYEFEMDIIATEITKLSEQYAAQTQAEFARIQAKYAQRAATIGMVTGLVQTAISLGGAAYGAVGATPSATGAAGSVISNPASSAASNVATSGVTWS